MTVLRENAQELASIAGEVGAEVLAGHLHYPSATGGWQLNDIDLDEYLARYGESGKNARHPGPSDEFAATGGGGD